VSPSSADPPPGGQPTLRVHVDHRAGRVAVVGRLGRRTGHLVHDAITVVLQSKRIRWLVDVTDLTADQTGLRVLGGVYRRLLRGGRQMILLGASPQLRQALRRLRLAPHVLDPADDPPP
jgi:anti-anti-sigma factor